VTPSKKVTLPVAAAGVTVAAMVRGWPRIARVAEVCSATELVDLAAAVVRVRESRKREELTRMGTSLWMARNGGKSRQ
jgi:hypothetical protein